ncbi:hypothetical protein Barb6XT_00685 [Bacteroidales bacterium Barb6XT]|nr:hypothetical protein Barb6XT_00685 [Bacteroidales bacterium Barb6XT]
MVIIYQFTVFRDVGSLLLFLRTPNRVSNPVRGMLRRCPERAKDFSPTCSAAECGVAECGVNGDADKEVLKGRPIYFEP